MTEPGLVVRHSIRMVPSENSLEAYLRTGAIQESKPIRVLHLSDTHFAAGFTQRSGITVTLDTRPTLGRLPADTERALFRVMQESLGNVHRHSGSPTATIRMARAATEVILEVSDRGRGLRLRGDGTVANAGVGLAGMRERVRQLGGRFEIQSSDKGTTVRAIVPGEAAVA